MVGVSIEDYELGDPGRPSAAEIKRAEDQRAAEHRHAELLAELSDHDRRMAEVVAHRVSEEWRRTYGEIGATVHTEHHRRIEQCVELQKRAASIWWDAVVKPAVGLGVIGFLTWLGMAVLQGIRGP